MDNSKNMQSEHLGVNKMGKSIRKSPLQQPNFSNNAARQHPQPQPQPQVYNISKNDFRNIVQQLTGAPSQEPRPGPPQNPQSTRLQRIRPPPLSPINLPQTPPPVPNNSSAGPFRPYAGGSHLSGESPISAYMRYLQTYMAGPSPRGFSGQPPLQPPIQSQNVGQVSAGNPTDPAFPPQMMSPYLPPPPPKMPSPTSQFLLPSPSFYSNLVSPRLPYPLPSPGIQFSPLLSPNFSFSPLAHLGSLGPWPHPPPSPGLFPLSPSGFFSFSSPK